MVLKDEDRRYLGDVAHLYEDAKRLVIEKQAVSWSMMQRHFGIKFHQAVALVDVMEFEGIVGPFRQGRNREVLVSEEDRP